MSKYTDPDFRNSALITIDTQCDTLDGQPFEVKGTSAILPKIKALLDAFREAKRPVVHIVRIYRHDGTNVDLCRRELIERGAQVILEGTDGCQPARELLPDPEIRLDAKVLLEGGLQHIGRREVIIYKPRWGAFYQTPLQDHLNDLKVNTLIFTGCNFPNCPRTSVYEASERDFRIILAEDAVSGIYDRGKEEVRSIGAQLMESREIINKMNV